MKLLLAKILIYPIFIVGAFWVSFMVVYPWFIPDPCYYHMHDVNAVLMFFFPVSGGHPEPGVFYIILTFLMGWFLARLVIKKISFRS